MDATLCTMLYVPFLSDMGCGPFTIADSGTFPDADLGKTPFFGQIVINRERCTSGEDAQLVRGMS